MEKNTTKPCGFFSIDSKTRGLLKNHNKSEPMNITFRKAQPKDVVFAVPLIYSSGPSAFEYVFKVSSEKDAKAFLKYAFVRPGSEFSYTNHTCLIQDDQKIVGIGAAFSSNAVTGFTLSAIRFIFSFYGILDGFKVIQRGLNIEKIIQPPKGNTEVLIHLGIQPDLRSRGLGSKMIHHFTKEAQKKGRDTTSLDVSAENPKAKALYERLGFKVKEEKISNLRNKFSYVPNHFKMARGIEVV